MVQVQANTSKLPQPRTSSQSQPPFQYHSEMRATIDSLPFEVFIMCMVFAIDGQPTGPLEYIMVSQRWQKLLLRTPSLWSRVYIQNGEDEMARTSTFLHLSQNHPLHVDIMTVLPNMDSLQFIARNITRVATISIRPGAAISITYLYMEQWKQSASRILATLYNKTAPPLVLSDVDHTQCATLSLLESDRWCYWVIFMQLTMRANRKYDPSHLVSVKSADNWIYVRMWEEHITRSICASAHQVERSSSINLTAGLASYARCRDAIRIAIPAFVTLLKDESFSVQAAGIDALDTFASYVELRGTIRLALVERLGHTKSRIRHAVIPAFVKVVQYAELRGSMMLSLPLLLELFEDPDLNTQMSTISGLGRLAGYVKSNELLRIGVPSLTERIRYMNADTRRFVISVLKELTAYDGCNEGEVPRVVIPPLIELLGHMDPCVRTSAVSVIQSFAGYNGLHDDGLLRLTIPSLIELLGHANAETRQSAIFVLKLLDHYYGRNDGEVVRVAIPSLISLLGHAYPSVRTSAISVIRSFTDHNEFHEELKVAVPSIVERLGDMDPGIRASAVFVIQTLAVYNGFDAELRVAIPSVMERLGDNNPGVRTSAASVAQSLANYDEFDLALRVEILSFAQRLGDNESAVRICAVSVLQNLTKYDKFHAALRAAIPSVIERLGDNDPGSRISAVSVVQSLAEYNEFHAALRTAIPSVIERLGDKDPGVRMSAVSVVQSLTEYNEFHAALRVAIPLFVGLLENTDPGVRISAVSVAQSFAEYDEFEATLTVAIPSFIKLLEDGQFGVRSSASFILYKLGHHPELAYREYQWKGQ